MQAMQVEHITAHVCFFKTLHTVALVSSLQDTNIFPNTGLNAVISSSNILLVESAFPTIGAPEGDWCWKLLPAAARTT